MFAVASRRATCGRNKRRLEEKESFHSAAERPEDLQVEESSSSGDRGDDWVSVYQVCLVFLQVTLLVGGCL